MKRVKAMLKFSPTAFIAWVGAWIWLFRGTDLIHPDWSDSAFALGTALAAIISLVVASLLAPRGQTSARWSALFFLIVAAIGFGLSLYFRHQLQNAAAGASQEYFKELWKWAFIALLAAIPPCAGSAVFSLLPR
jgi:hypothetical protein